uniref:Ricin B lectin domain-containing protein n=1 Tax=Kwoniella pini CBS 10737 TaxID=1296096 RepID=A0A1B9ICG4_9TREE|nr:uncharacterized protein I206_00425 [Kwoniella pini CBS 10737]OCF53124.1 hypothetical protein I206_00425 [Kwoniella pini CBS 10737]
MFNLVTLLPLLALIKSGQAKPLPQAGDVGTATSTNSSAHAGYPPATSSASTTVNTNPASGQPSETSNNLVAVDQSTPTDSIYSNATLHGVQIQSYRDGKCLSPDPRTTLQDGLPVDLYPCVNSDNTSVALAWDITPGVGSLIISGTDFALVADEDDIENPNALVLKQSCGCEDLTPWYTTNDGRISIYGAGVCLTEDKDTDKSGPDQDLGIVLYKCTDQDTDQMFLTINNSTHDLEPIVPPNAEYSAARESAIAAAQTGTMTAPGEAGTTSSKDAGQIAADTATTSTQNAESTSNPNGDGTATDSTDTNGKNDAGEAGGDGTGSNGGDGGSTDSNTQNGGDGGSTDSNTQNGGNGGSTDSTSQNSGDSGSTDSKAEDGGSEDGASD